MSEAKSIDALAHLVGWVALAHPDNELLKPTQTAMAQLRAALLEAPAPQHDSDMQAVYDVFGIGAKVREPHILLENARNARRRSDCLWEIEREFTIQTPPEPGDGDEPGEECLLNWGEEPAQYIKRFREVLRAHPPAVPVVLQEPVAEVVSWTSGSHSRNYKLRWLRDVPEGTKLYASIVRPEPVPGNQQADLVSPGPSDGAKTAPCDGAELEWSAYGQRSFCSVCGAWEGEPHRVMQASDSATSEPHGQSELTAPLSAGAAEALSPHGMNPAEPADALADYKRIATLIGVIYAFGNFKAETFNERELEKLLRKVGCFWETREQCEAAVMKELHHE